MSKYSSSYHPGPWKSLCKKVWEYCENPPIFSTAIDYCGEQFRFAPLISMDLEGSVPTTGPPTSALALEEDSKML